MGRFVTPKPDEPLRGEFHSVLSDSKCDLTFTPLTGLRSQFQRAALVTISDTSPKKKIVGRQRDDGGGGLQAEDD